MRSRRAVGQRQRPAVRLNEFRGDDEAEPRAALFGRAVKRLEQIFARLRGMPAPLSVTSMMTLRPSRCAATRTSPSVLPSTLSIACIAVAHEVAQRPEKMLVVGIDAQRRIHVGDEGDGALARQALAVRHLLD